MELQFHDEGRRGRIVMGLGLVLAVVAGGAAYFAVSQAQEEGGQGALQRVPAVVALTVLQTRQPITADQVEVRQIPLDDTNLHSVAQVELVVGRIPIVPILQGQMVTSNLLAVGTNDGSFSILSPGETVGPDSPYWRAVSITVPDDLAVGGLLQPGQTVDVFVTALVLLPEQLIEEGRYYSDRSTKIVYQDVPIIARVERAYVLKAHLQIAEEIAHLQASGTATFSLALRPDIDIRVADASSLGATTTRIITKYGLPIPETYPAGFGPIRTPPPLATPLPPPTPSSPPAVSPPPP
jgi:Flp pilus assembly protein CpaB